MLVLMCSPVPRGRTRYFCRHAATRNRLGSTTMKSKSLHPEAGFTLIELLVVILILSILMAIAMPLYLSSIEYSKRRTCRANMQTIANAVQAARTRNDLPDFAPLIADGVTTGSLLDFVAIPVCPEGGAYTLTNGSSGDATTFRVVCSVSDHGTFQPGLDSD